MKPQFSRTSTRAELLAYAGEGRVAAGVINQKLQELKLLLMAG